MMSNDWFLEMLMYGTYTEREIRFLLIYQLSIVMFSFIVVLLLELFWRKRGEEIMSKNYHEETIENLENLENLENPVENLKGTLEESLEGTLEESVEESTEENTAKNIEENIEEDIEESTDEIIEESLDEDMEAENLSCVEDEDRIFILDENGKSVELEVEDDVADD